MPGSIKIDDGSGNYTILTNAGSLGSDKTITIPNTTGTAALTSDVDLVFLGTSTVSSATDITFDNVFSADYDNYIIEGYIQPATSSQDITLRFRDGSGDVTTSSYSYKYIYGLDSNSTAINNGIQGSGYSEMKLIYQLGNSRPTFFKLFLQEPFNAQYTQLSHIGSVEGHILLGGGGFENATKSFTGVKCYMSSGNITSGKLSVYGYKNS